MQALQPFDGVVPGEGLNRVYKVQIENLFPGHCSENDTELTLTQNQLNEITIDHATMYINECVITKLEAFGFPKNLVRAQVQGNVLNHATASYHLLML